MSVNKFVGLLFNSRTQAHVFHLLTPYYSQHKALEKYYEKIVDLTDDYAEAYMGTYGRMKKIGTNSRFLRDPKKARMYFMNLLKRIRHLRLPKDTHLRNIQDEIIGLIRRTIYMLSLK